MNSLSILSSTVDKVIGSSPPPPPQKESIKSLRRSYRSNKFHISSLNKDDDTTGHSFYTGLHDISDTLGDNPGVLTEDDDRTDSRIIETRRSVVSAKERLCALCLTPCLDLIQWVLSSIAISVDWLLSFVDDEVTFLPVLLLRRMAGVHISNELIHSDGSNSLTGPTKESIFDSNAAGDFCPNHNHSIELGEIETCRMHNEQIMPRRSIRIRLYNEEQFSHKKGSIKSPTSPSLNLRVTKYPRDAGPPVSLLSRAMTTKTLILDLDETLIHSLAKGGRMTSGHMVEVKLDRQHAILYYVHKRPYCDEFLRKVCRWYNLVIFTASVQEYADPVIDWLEQDRKYFKGRYYRQHCTNRNGAYIKDIATVEPDLSKVMIIDNSPMSYIFHEDNAIPIEGWINDPTDIDLLHLIPLLQALQYAADVRALLALRMGESYR